MLRVWTEGRGRDDKGKEKGKRNILFMFFPFYKIMTCIVITNVQQKKLIYTFFFWLQCKREGKRAKGKSENKHKKD